MTTDVHTYRNPAGVVDAVHARAKAPRPSSAKKTVPKKLNAARMCETLVHNASEGADARIGRMDRRRVASSVLSPPCCIQSQLPKGPAASS